MRTLVIGDIHGNFTALKEVLKKADYNASADRLITLGDVVDGYAMSFEVVNYLKDLPNTVHIRGNHDYWAQWLFSCRKERTNRVYGLHRVACQIKYL